MVKRWPLWAILPFGGVGLLLGLMGGYHRLGWPVFGVPGSAAAEHGALMTGTFFGTLIALERAVAIKRWWAFIPAWACALSMPALVLGIRQLGFLLLGLGGIGMAVVFGVLLRRYQYFPFALMGGAAALFALGWGMRLAGIEFVRVAPVLIGFFILTIVAERLELTRILGAERQALQWLLGLVVVLLLGIGVELMAAHWQMLGIALGGIGGWLLRYDVALRALRRPVSALHRYTAGVLAIGYGWLLVTMLMSIVGAASALFYDALVHSFFVGFVFAMVFAHGIMIFPALLGRQGYAWTGWLWVPVGLTFGGLIGRLWGDFAGVLSLRLQGSWLIGVGILLYVLLVLGRTLRLPRAPLAQRGRQVGG